MSAALALAMVLASQRRSRRLDGGPVVGESQYQPVVDKRCGRFTVGGAQPLSLPPPYPSLPTPSKPEGVYSASNSQLGAPTVAAWPVRVAHGFSAVAWGVWPSKDYGKWW